MFPGIAIGIIIVVILLVFGYVKAPPDQAYIISGLKKDQRILIGRAGFRVPFFERLDRLYLGQMTVDIKTEQSVPTNDFINVNVDAVAKVRISPQPDGIRLAAKNFLNAAPEKIACALQDSLQGNMREIIGTLTLKAINTDRDSFSNQIEEKASKDMAKLGIEMLDLGATVEEIAEKSGFSEKTIRRRVKMMELDQKTLKEVSVRQLTLGDFDALAQVEDIKERNKVLESIGTRDFDANLSRALSVQAERRNRPIVKAWLKEIGAKEISSQDAWSSKYESYPGCGYYIYLSKWGEDGNKPPENIKGEVFYVLERTSLRLYKKREKAKPEKKPPEQIAKEKAISAAWKSLEESASLAYDLRKAFVEKLTVTKKNRETVLFGALLSVLMDSISYVSQDGETIKALLGIEFGNYYEPNKHLKIAEKIGEITDEKLPRLVYAGFGDDAKDLCTGSTYKGNFPEFHCSGKLKLLYEWLQRLGYEISTEEQSMMDGTHAGFHAKEAYDGRT